MPSSHSFSYLIYGLLKIGVVRLGLWYDGECLAGSGGTAACKSFLVTLMTPMSGLAGHTVMHGPSLCFTVAGCF